MAEAEQIEFAPGMRVLVRGQEWLVRKVETNTLGNKALYCCGISSLVKDRDSIFLSDLDRVIPVDPAKTRIVADDSPNYRKTRLYLESQLRNKAPQGPELHVGQKACMESKAFQLEPAYLALKQPRQRILIADAVGLGKTLEAGILMSELIARGKGKRILVVTAKSILTQFQMEMWNRFTIPLVRLDSARIQQIRQQIPSNANPFYYYDKTIVSIDTIKRGVEYGVHLENAYWDIIVIDEAQNVAERGHKSAQRAKLAEKLSKRSDTLIMLSATPHDGKPKSFASLMRMLDPTAISDDENYTKDDIKGLFVRRLKKDVPNQFQERNVESVPCRASAQEERAFDVFSEISLKMDATKTAGSGQLFKTSLEKALFSSPAACIKTIENRLAKLAKSDPCGATGDAAQLVALKDALEQIEPEQFSRYQGLLKLLRDPEYGWSSDNPNDRIVIFTERIETMKWVRDRLRLDLRLKDDHVISMDGGMTDMEQQDVVAEFAKEDSPIRVLVASDVASEGINLHYQSHRLIHFDTPWSLMVFQQRNGRIDRFGQTERPEIRFLTVEASNEKIKGDARILQILIDKEQQASKNIGDPAMLMGKYSVDEETLEIQQVMEKPDGASELEKNLGSAVMDPLEMMMALTQGKELPGQVPTQDDNTLMDDMQFLDLGIKEFGEKGGVVSMEKLDGVDGRRIKVADQTELSKRMKKIMPQATFKDNTFILSPDKQFCSSEIERARSAEFELGTWPQAQYLWRLHPVLDWIADKASMQQFKRDEAPIVACEKIKPGRFIYLVAGVIPNKKSSPVIDEWFGVDVDDGLIKVIAFDQVESITSIDDERIPNSIDVDQSVISKAEGSLEQVVEAAKQHLRTCYEAYRKRIDPQIDEEVEKLSALREKHMDRQLSLFPEGRKLSEAQRRVEELFDSYTDWVTETLEIQDKPNIRVMAVFVGAE